MRKQVPIVVVLEDTHGTEISLEGRADMNYLSDWGMEWETGKIISSYFNFHF